MSTGDGGVNDAGVRRVTARAPASVTFGWLKGECERLERVLRMQHVEPGALATGREQLPDEWERGLALNPLGEDTTAALRRWAYLKHLYLVRSEKLHRARAADQPGISETARKLLRRDPVTVELSNGRRVRVTARSYAASHAIAQHWARVQMLDTERFFSAGSRLNEATMFVPLTTEESGSVYATGCSWT